LTPVFHFIGARVERNQVLSQALWVGCILGFRVYVLWFMVYGLWFRV
jgi:hypothetical protein